MIYLKTIDLWDKATAKAIETGQIKLQRGQWVQCGGGAKSRFVCKKPKSIWVAHSEGKLGTKESFKRLCEAAKNYDDRPLKRRS